MRDKRQRKPSRFFSLFAGEFLCRVYRLRNGRGIQILGARNVSVKNSCMAQQLLRLRVSSWLRQTKWRARQKNRWPNLQLSELWQVFESHKFQCAYCDSPAQTADMAFPMTCGGPVVASNILPTCKACAGQKCGKDLIAYYQTKQIDDKRLEAIMASMMRQDQHCNHVMRKFVKDYMESLK